GGRGVVCRGVVRGVGGLGLDMLKQLRAGLRDRFDALDNLPHVRFLYLDTDPEGLQVAGHEKSGPALAGREMLLLRLQRPGHYLKLKSDGPSLENWMLPKMLYRIPRQQVPHGVRALGRLAFVDNVRTVRARVRQELEACIDPNLMTDAKQGTGLDLRTNRPRVYVLAGLMGGTGGGMFIDLAYVVRQHLRQLGVSQPELVGVFLVPPV